MNFLAHCLLAGPGAGFVAGGVLGDFVKGQIADSLPPELGAGIRLHRRIDSYSNRLPGMKVSVARFDPALRRVAPVLLDIVADHCLALSWQKFGKGDLAAFTAEVYAAIGDFQEYVPTVAKPFVDRLVKTDLLGRYAEPPVIQRAMEHVLERLRLTHLDARLTGVLAADLPALLADFHDYFPMLRAFAEAERRTLSAAIPDIAPKG